MRTLIWSLIAATLATAVPAQTLAIDCSAAQNATNEECLGLPPAQEATNFVPLIAPALGGLAAVAGLAAAAGASGEGGNTTTSTTSTVPD